MNRAYVETTILTNVLLKPGSKKQAAARSALSRYEETLLPVYSIKEWKAGPLDHYFLRSRQARGNALPRIHPISNKRLESGPRSSQKGYFGRSVGSSCYARPGRGGSPRRDLSRDEELADRYRLALASLIKRSWQKRRKVTTETIQDLECYTEAEPRIGKDGFYDLTPKECERDRECCLAERLKTNRDALVALRASIPENSRRYKDKNRRKVLKQLINTPKILLDRDQCRWLGDAVFAFFCPEDAVILTTNIGDHQRLAKAVGKRAEKP